MKKFWDWMRNEEGERVLRLEGPIDAESFWGDEITPQDFRDELESEGGNVILWINSPGGNVFAAAEIYTMLREYKGTVTVRIASIAASAASVVAMAGDTVQMSPTALLMCHDPMTLAMGNARDMEKAIATLDEVKQSIINAYQAKTGLSRNRISKIMENETWLNAKKAVELGFADEILYEQKKPQKSEEEAEEEQETSEEEKEEEDEDSDSGKSMKLKASTAVWQYSGRMMNETMLNHLGCLCHQAKVPGDVAEEDDSPMNDRETEGPPQNTPEPVDDIIPADEAKPVKEAQLTDNSPPEEDQVENVQPVDDTPVIGLDGKTEDGSMPYTILMEKLEWLK